MDYKDLTKTYESLEKTTKRLEKTAAIAELLKKTPKKELSIVLPLLEGRIFPKWDQRELGVASRLVLKSMNIASGISIEKIEDMWKKEGDLGDVAETIFSKKEQSTLFSSKLDIKKVFENFQKLALLEGQGTVDRKVKLIAELLTSAEPLEAKYITRTVLQDLRIGVGEGSLRDAIVWAYFGEKIGISYNKKENNINLDEEKRELYNKYSDTVQNAYDMLNQFSEVAEIAKDSGLDGLKKVKLKVNTPINLMLFQKAEDLEDAFKRVGRPAAIEYKYDGFRLEIHKKDNSVKLFTRRLEDVSRQFPDVIRYIEENIDADSFILDAEIIGIDLKTGKYKPFQDISQRIKRKYNIEQIAKNIPVMVNLFDIILLNNKNLIKEPFKKRREQIEKITKPSKFRIAIAEQIITDNVEKANEFYQKALSIGNEGIMVKNLEAPYKPGSRVGYGVKVKPVMETLDLVITGAEWGEGKRANWLSSFIISCIDNGEFKEIGRVGTGIKEKGEEGITFEQLTKMLGPLITKEKAKHVDVKPKIVIEVDYEEIQKSPTYSSGFALRFPRVVRLRDDKPPEEISSLRQIKGFYDSQRQRNR